MKAKQCSRHHKTANKMAKKQTIPPQEVPKVEPTETVPVVEIPQESIVQEETVNDPEEEIPVVEAAPPPQPAILKEERVELPYKLVEKQGFAKTFLEILQEKSNNAPIKVNDILKSFYAPVPANVAPFWQQQPRMKVLRHELQLLINAKKIVVVGDKHNQLGRAYFHGNNPQTQYYHIGDIPLEVSLT